MIGAKRARSELKGYLRDYGYDDPPGLNIVCRRTEKFDYNDVSEAKQGEGKPVVMWRRLNSEWLAIMPLKDFMDIYREWEMNTADKRELPFYGEGECEEE